MLRNLIRQTSFLLCTEIANELPVVVMDSKPLTVSRTDVDVNRAKIVIFLVTCDLKQYHRGQHKTKYGFTDPVKSSKNQMNVTLVDRQGLCIHPPGVRLPGTFMYSCTEFIPRMVCPT